MLVGVTLAGALALSVMTPIQGGEFRPLYIKQDKTVIQVEDFSMDSLPVTNHDFFEFVSGNPLWIKDHIPAIFADTRYLVHWQRTDDPDQPWQPAPSIMDNAVVNVSWFAAQAYCESRGKRLPTVAQWEYVAKASESSADGRDEPGHRQKILDWYGKHHTPDTIMVAQAEPNYWGVYDLHGLVWEWTEDFNSALVSGESLGDSAIDRGLYCAAGTVGSADPSDYAAFLRYGFRSSLYANFNLSNLGFRCVSE